MVARAIKGRLAVFGSSTLYTFKTLQSGAQDVNGLVCLRLGIRASLPPVPSSVVLVSFGAAKLVGVPR